MKAEDVFQKLSAELSNKERQKILSDILKNAEDRVVPSAYHYSSDMPLDIEEQEARLNFIQRFIVWLHSLIYRKEKSVALKEYIIQQMVRRLSTKTGLITRDRLYLTPIFYKNLQKIAEVATFFKPSVLPSLEHQSSFYAFLGRVVLTDHYNALVSALVTQKISLKSGIIEESAIKKRVDQQFESLMGALNTKEKDRMSENAAMLVMLQELCSFEFKEFLSLFKTGPGASSCLVASASKYLKKLSKILSNIDYEGGASLFEALYLFVYYVDDRMDEVYRDPFEKWMRRAFGMILQLQKIIHDLSLRDLTACVLEDYFFHVPNMDRGSNWFHFYYKFWSRYKDREVHRFLVIKRFENHRVECIRQLKLSKFPELKYYGVEWSQLYEQQAPFASTLAWCGTLAKWIDQKMGYTFKMLVGEGQFYKRQNQQEFLDALEIILATPKRMKKIDEATETYFNSPVFKKEMGVKSKSLLATENETDGKSDGDIELSSYTEEALLNMRAGKWDAANKKRTGLAQSASGEEPSDEIQSRLDLERKVDRTVKEFKESLFTLTHLLRGILYGQGEGSYDTLSNLSYLGGSSNDAFVSKLKIYLDDIDYHYQALNKLYDLESLIE